MITREELTERFAQMPLRPTTIDVFSIAFEPNGIDHKASYTLNVVNSQNAHSVLWFRIWKSETERGRFIFLFAHESYQLARFGFSTEMSREIQYQLDRRCDHITFIYGTEPLHPLRLKMICDISVKLHQSRPYGDIRNYHGWQIPGTPDHWWRNW